MKKDMFYFSELQYSILIKYGDDVDLKDSLLVNCQQMIETALMGSLKSVSGTYERTHSLYRLCRTLDESLAKKYDSLLRLLTSCYYDNRYESDDYIDYSWEEFLDVKACSIELYKLLVDKYRTPNESKPLNHFNKR